MRELIYGIFDWDDNILHMPTLIKAFDKIENKYVWLTTEQYAKVRNTDHSFEFDTNSFDLFYDYIEHNFITDIERALSLETLGPSYNRLIELVKEGRIIAIVTARGHEAETLKQGCIYLIKKAFNKEDVEIWHQNLREYRKLFNLPDVNDEQLEFDYWNECYFVGLGVKKNDIGKIIRKVEDQKKNEIVAFVDNVAKRFSNMNLPISIGFSDDDVSNLQKIHELFISLYNIYPSIKFRLYDTSNRGLKKIIIE